MLLRYPVSVKRKGENWVFYGDCGWVWAVGEDTA